jgi:hypothetical protein
VSLRIGAADTAAVKRARKRAGIEFIALGKYGVFREEGNTVSAVAQGIYSSEVEPQMTLINADLKANG